MDSNSTYNLQEFISANNLKTKEGIIFFNAAVTLHSNGSPTTILSEIQVVTLPNEMVLYVMEFVKDVYHESDIYSTSYFFFNYPGKNTIEIRDQHYKDLLHLSVTSAGKQEKNVQER